MTTKALTPIQQAKSIRNSIIAEQILSGITADKIAAEHNISKSNVYKLLRRDDIRELIDSTQRMYAFNMPAVSKRFMELCLDTDDKAISLNAIKEYNKIMGFSPTHTESVFIQNIYNDNRQGSDQGHAVLRAIHGSHEDIQDADFEVCNT